MFGYIYCDTAYEIYLLHIWYHTCIHVYAIKLLWANGGQGIAFAKEDSIKQKSKADTLWTYVCTTAIVYHPWAVIRWHARIFSKYSNNELMPLEYHSPCLYIDCDPKAKMLWYDYMIYIYLLPILIYCYDWRTNFVIDKWL